MKPVRILESARTDIRAEKTYYRKISPELALKFHAAVEAAINAIPYQPLSMQARDFEIRRWPVDGFPHGVLYRVTETEILILSVFHPKQAPERWKLRGFT